MLSTENIPQVSVVIPTYNQLGLLEKTIDSVLNQTYQDYEVIVVDDGSQDNTRELVNSFQNRNKRIKYFYQKNKGVSAARNLGITNARGKYIALLDHDDRWLPHYLEESVKFLERDKSIELVFSWVIGVDKADNLIAKRLAKKIRDIVLSIQRDYTYKNKFIKFKDFIFPCFLYYRQYNFALPSTSVFRKRLWLNIGFFDENISFTEDLDFSLRASKKYRFGYINRIGVKYTIHSKNTSLLAKNRELILNACVRVWGKTLENVSPLEKINFSLVKRNISRTRFTLANYLFTKGEFSKARINYRLSLQNRLNLKSIIGVCLLRLFPSFWKRLYALIKKP